MADAKRFFVPMVLLLTLAVSLIGASGTEEQNTASMRRLQDAIGMELATADRALTGEVGDFVVNQTGSILYVVAKFDQPADQWYLVSSDRFVFDAQNNNLRIDTANVDELSAGLLLDYAPEERSLRPVYTSRFKDSTAIGWYGDVLGRVDDAMLDLKAERVAYLGIAPAGMLGVDQLPLYRIPVSRVTDVDPNYRRITTSMSVGEFQNSQGFNDYWWPRDSMR